MLEITVWDVQHGSAAYINTPNNKHIAIDLGTGSYAGDKTFSPLLHLKNKYKVARLDAVIITHPHRDHLDDIFNFAELSPKSILRPKHLSDDDIRKGNRKEDAGVVNEYLRVVDGYGGDITPENNIGVPDSFGGVNFKWFISKKSATTNLNNHSFVVIISYAKSKIIIPGDNEPASWNELLADKDFESAIAGTDIFFAPHHGRESGYSKELFEKINPYLCIVSDGRFCETSASSRYSAKARGWTVHRKDGSKEERKCLTTRSDGYVYMKFGYNEPDKPYMSINIA